MHLVTVYINLLRWNPKISKNHISKFQPLPFANAFSNHHRQPGMRPRHDPTAPCSFRMSLLRTAPLVSLGKPMEPRFLAEILKWSSNALNGNWPYSCPRNKCYPWSGSTQGLLFFQPVLARGPSWGQQRANSARNSIHHPKITKVTTIMLSMLSPAPGVC